MIELSEVTKSYGWGIPGRRQVQALRGVTFSVEPGSSLGIVGLNGAGKSTLLRILLGYVRPSSGEATLAGLPPRAYAEKFGVAYVPERVSIQRGWTVRGALRAYAMLGEIGEDAWQRVEGAIDRLGLRELADRKIGSLSKGNVQRVGIAQALLGERKLMVLDEPTDGLDPVWIAELREVVRNWLSADPERTLVLASHNLAEVERLTSRVLLLHGGVLEGELESENGDEPLERRFLSRLSQLRGARG
ncbi:MAG: ABC transporter ATP-binding protein [Gemmatimonadota bacterium]